MFGGSIIAMKIFLGIMVLGFLWCGNANAVNESAKYTHEVNFDHKGFILRQDQKSLTYKTKLDF